MSTNWEQELDAAVDRRFDEMVQIRRHLHQDIRRSRVRSGRRVSICTRCWATPGWMCAWVRMVAA